MGSRKRAKENGQFKFYGYPNGAKDVRTWISNSEGPRMTDNSISKSQMEMADELQKQLLNESTAELLDGKKEE